LPAAAAGDKVYLHLNQEIFMKEGKKNKIHGAKASGTNAPQEILVKAAGIQPGGVEPSCPALDSKLTGAALRDSELRYRRLFEAAQDGILILEAETGIIVDANPFILNLLGFSLEQLTGKNLWEIGALKDVFENKEKFKELQNTGYARYEGLPLVASDGRKLFVEFVSNTYVVGDSKVIQCNIRDNTDLTRTRGELTESKAILDMVVENVPLMIFLKDAKDLRYALFNRAGEELTGYARNDLLGKSDLDFFPPEQAAYFMGRDREVLDGKSDFLDIPEEPILTAKKGTRLLHTRKVSVRDKDGVTKYLLGISEDITDRKQVELYREVSREILVILNKSSNLEDSIKDIVGILKTRGGFDAVGLRLQEKEDFPYFYQDGFSEDFLLTENTLAARTADGGVCRDKAGKVCLECTCGLVISGNPNPGLTKGGTFWTNDSLPLLNLPADQDPRLDPRNLCVHKNYASVALTPIRSKEAIVGLLQLNSRRKGCFSEGIIAQLENMAASIGEALLRKRAEQEREAMRGELMQSRKMESIGRLAGGVAHDFNNLLTAIIGYGGFLMKGLAEGDAKREDVKEILTAAERAAGLTQQLLAFSRKQVLKTEVADLNSVVWGIEKLLRRLMGEEIKLETKYAKAPCLVQVDIGQIEQVLVNLAVNAKDAMPKGGTLTLETALVDQGGDFSLKHADFPPGRLVCLTIKDTGCGMADKIKEHIFEPFFTTKETGKGTGLGLSTVFGIVKQSGGEIEVESAPDSGTTFQIYIPYYEEAVVAKDKAADKEKETLLSGSETVLLVEDEESLRRLGERLLRASGYTVLSAANGKEALEVMGRYGKSVDLLLTDVVMPGMSGRELATELGNRKLIHRTLFMSGYTDDAITKHGVLEPGLAFIYKPFTVETLSRKLREVLDGPADKAKA